MKNRPVSQKLQRRVLGLQSKFDPRKIGNMMAGSLGASSTYKLSGEKSKQQKVSVNTLSNTGNRVGKLDTAEHTSISEDQTQRMKKGDGIADVIAKIVNFYKKSHEEMVLQKELTRDFEEEEHEKEKRKHAKFVKQIKKTKGAPKEDKLVSKDIDILSQLKKKLESIIDGVVGGITGLVTKSAALAVKVLPAAAVVGAAAVSTKSIAELLKSGEGGDYNQLVYATPKGRAAQVPNTASLTSMTIAQVFALQDQMRSSGNYASTAVGRYQIIKETLKGAVQSLDLDPNTPFNEVTQDKIFNEYIISSKRKNLQAFISGKSTNEESAVMDLALEFASVGVPRDVKRGEFGKYPIRDIKKGESVYSGVAENKANISPEKGLQAIKNDKLNSLMMKTPKSEVKSTPVDIVKPVTVEPKVGEKLNRSSELQLDNNKVNGNQTSPTIVDTSTVMNNMIIQQMVTVTTTQPKSDKPIILQNPKYSK